MVAVVKKFGTLTHASPRRNQPSSQIVAVPATMAQARRSGWRSYVASHAKGFRSSKAARFCFHCLLRVSHCGTTLRQKESATEVVSARQVWRRMIAARMKKKIDQ